MELITIAIWILMGVWASNIAQKKNRDKVGWFILGLIFGLFAVAAVYIVDPLPPKEANPQNPQNPQTNPQTNPQNNNGGN